MAEKQDEKEFDMPVELPYPASLRGNQRAVLFVKEDDVYGYAIFKTCC
jgi:hypothetical protein